LRFGPSTYENHQAQLFKLKQTGSVSEYQAIFEKLGNRVIGLPADAMLNCFISGLNPEIKNEIAIQKPYTISQAIGLAKLVEVKFGILNQSSKDLSPHTTTHNHNPISPRHKTQISLKFPHQTQQTNLHHPQIPSCPLGVCPQPKCKKEGPWAYATIVKKNG
jgi:hypothetical protein